MCVCQDGFVMQDGECIPESNCGCILETGEILENGYTGLNTGCGLKCQCLDGFYWCDQHQCPDDTECTLQNGVYACIENFIETDVPKPTGPGGVILQSEMTEKLIPAHTTPGLNFENRTTK